jgi:EAL domain-containing protein (putative c-di-GMP-specific phosphodiesterase class I)
MRLPVHEIKIDRSFVAGLGTDSDSGAIVRSAVGLGHNLGLRVVAEGLQDRLAEAVLIEAGCDAAQGFLFGRPVTDVEMTTQLMTNPGSKGIPIEPGAHDGATAAALVQEGSDPKGI